ncbi:MAG: helix-turn-helix transcriptional regulator [Ruminiclostridium sp.]|nr:helix-turn-helix transcriptional regulator [Ruminiclostridium sp.]
MNFYERLKSLREERGYTQEKLAAVIHVTKNSVSHYERNISLPTIDVLISLADIFDVSLDYLLGRTDYNISDRILKKQLANKMSVGKFVEKVANLDTTHKLDILKALYYIEADNKRTKN